VEGGDDGKKEEDQRGKGEKKRELVHYCFPMTLQEPSRIRGEESNEEDERREKEGKKGKGEGEESQMRDS